ncbi:uncharacterized protein FIBRA_02893 [Fibroporia radiculosa]|uniref:Abscisic acid G-protein coupled receptor-like domain-containing protein n=1 Tax=Fibroporia radiculosa TaxID=599839 RepID=J4GN65_9APHY|nr:uncharacterized protein FIBRA_02893 [Fibroporia radiculosa]CCM00850.1 predicted protein [Fibroporia radiculosa]
MASPGAQLALESSFLLLVRLALFFSCRKFLLRHLYYDLQDLSAKRPLGSRSTSASASTDDVANIELESFVTLPLPSTSESASPEPPRRPFHSTLARGLFALCFSESCTLFVLLMCQALEILHARARLINWNISLALLLLAILVLIPVSYSLVLTGLHTRQRPSALRIVLNLVPVCLLLLALSYIPLPSVAFEAPPHSMLMDTLSRLTVLGTIILGALSGFGAISNAWTFFPAVRGGQRSDPTEEEIRAAELGLQRVQSDLSERQMEVQKLEAAKQPDQEGGWFSRVVPSFRGDSRTCFPVLLVRANFPPLVHLFGAELSSARQELRGLEALEYEMARNLEVLRQRRADAQFSRTIAGRLVNWGGRLFAVYCMYRILNAIINLALPARSAIAPTEGTELGTAQGGAGADMISVALVHLVALLPHVSVSSEEIASISRQISLALVGVIILSSIRLVLRGVARALRVTSRALGASLMLLVLAQLMGIYLLSTLVQLRTSFPPPARPDAEADEANLFATLPQYQLFGALFDGTLLIVAVGSIAARWFGDRLREAGT